MSVDMSKHFSTSALIRFTLPTIAMMIFTSCYTIVDGFFVSNYAGKTALAAVNLIVPAVMILASVGMMIGTGGSALVAKTLGEGDRPRARRHFSLLVIFAFAVGSVLSLGGWFFMEPTATMLGATPGSQMHHDAALYGRMMMISLPFFILQYAFQSFFVTAGKPKYGFLVIVAAGVANILWTSCSSACSAGDFPVRRSPRTSVNSSAAAFRSSTSPASARRTCTSCGRTCAGASSGALAPTARRKWSPTSP
ncbi:MAG: MATE family efflux transporter [Adlercreutzia equolifaciens]